jgi:alanine racemase
MPQRTAVEARMGAGARLTIDWGALAANYRLLCDQVAPAKVAGVVKADGYGLGADRWRRCCWRRVASISSWRCCARPRR